MMGIFKPFWLMIIKWGATIGFVLMVLFRVRQSGKDAVYNEQVKESLEGVKARDEIENSIINASDDKYNKLRKKWTR